MATVDLSNKERLLLTRVLDLQLALTRKRTPLLQPLSLYSSELKGRKQIAGSLDKIRSTRSLSDSEVARNRYFNTLSNQALVEGTADAPRLTPLASHYLDALDNGADDAFWQGSGGDAVELAVVRALAARLGTGAATSGFFRQVWFGAQTFFDYVPPLELPTVLASPDFLLKLFRINSNGWEIARYFRLDEAERAAFDAAFAKVPPSADWEPARSIEVAAAKYKDAAATYQNDVRFRISGFLNAYETLRQELGAALPRLDRQLVLRTGATDGADSHHRASPPAGTRTAGPTATPLPHPHQLIVTGCPGSGKSYYLDVLLAAVDCTVIRTQFHPESSFFDFIGAYKPQPVYEPAPPAGGLLEGDGSPFTRGRPLIDYRFVPGPLMRGLAHALSHPDQNVVIVIEEINRGNAASILGDMLQLLDRDASGASRYPLAASAEQRAFLAGEGHALDEIRLPANLYLWATMNSADQGVFPLDTAFRRRWDYVYKGYAEPCSYANATVLYGGVGYRWDDLRATINTRLLELGIHEDKLIGPYFLTEQQLMSPGSILEKLFLYLWDDVLRFRQDALFTARSFSLVSTAWAGGMGAPLTLSLPVPVAGDGQEGQDGQDRAPDGP